MQHTRIKGLFLAGFATLVWGCQYPIGRFIFGEMGEISPVVASMYKFIFGAIALLPFALYSAPSKNFAKAVRNDFPKLFCLAAFGVFAEGFLSLYSLKFTTAARSSLLCNMSPMFTVIVAAIFARRWPCRMIVLGVIIGIIGSYLTISSSASDIYAPSAHTLAGDILALLSGVAWAYFTVDCTTVAQKYGALVCTTILLALSALFLLLWCLATGSGIVLVAPLKVWGCIFFLGALGTGICVGLWNMAALHVPSDALGAFGYASAAIGMTAGIVGFHESITWRFVFAIACCMSAVWIMNKYDGETKNGHNHN